jgi:hypothetical protein
VANFKKFGDDTNENFMHERIKEKNKFKECLISISPRTSLLSKD